MTYLSKTFNLPALEGLSEEQIKAHLGLYDGYVRHVNLIMGKIKELTKANTEENSYLIAELRRRFAFEFDGMRMHELYFEQLEEGGKTPNEDGALAAAASAKYGNGIDGLTAHIKEVAGTRGIGWVAVYLDAVEKTLHTVFVVDHETGHLAGLPILLVLDLWEHAYMVDYVPSEKKNYVDAFFANLNWSVVEKRFEAAI